MSRDTTQHNTLLKRKEILMAKGMGAKGQRKVEKVMHEWGKGKLHSGSSSGPVVKSQKQAVAIALSQGRKASKQ